MAGTFAYLICRNHKTTKIMTTMSTTCPKHARYMSHPCPKHASHVQNMVETYPTYVQRMQDLLLRSRVIAPGCKLFAPLSVILEAAVYVLAFHT